MTRAASTPNSIPRHKFREFVAKLGLSEKPAEPRKTATGPGVRGLRGAPVVVVQRNNTLTRLAGAARRMGVEEDGIAAILETANKKMFDTPLDQDEVRRIAGSVARYEPRDGATVLSTLTDAANADRLGYYYGNGVRYVAEWGKWIIWDASHWRIDDTGRMNEFAKETARRIYEEAARQSDPQVQKEIVAHARKSQQLERLRAMIKLAASLPGLVVLAQDLDKDPMLLGVRNGVVDLRTGELRPAAPEDLMTMQCPVDFDDKATCPEWMRFLDRITAGDAELTGYMTRVVGYSLTGNTSEQCLFFLHGSGANGKTTFLNVVKDVLGPDYCKQTPPDSLMVKKQGRSATNDLARLKGVRVTISNEVEEGSRMSESLIKQMTGSDIISARFLFKEFFDFLPQFKILIAGNHQPVIRGTDDGIWRRLQLIPFTVTIPPEERDKALPDKLRAELPGILNWAVKGCLEWQKVGLRPPLKIVEAVAEYKKEMDILGQWIDERCELAGAAKVQASAAYDHYKHWAIRNGYQVLSINAFGRRLKERFVKEHTRDGTFYSGLQLKASAVGASWP